MLVPHFETNTCEKLTFLFVYIEMQ